MGGRSRGRPYLRPRLSPAHYAGIASALLLILYGLLRSSLLKSDQQQQEQQVREDFSPAANSRGGEGGGSRAGLGTGGRGKSDEGREDAFSSLNTHLCKRWTEDSHLHSARHSRLPYDGAMSKVSRPPRAGHEWQLVLTDDVEHGLLGLHNFDSSFEYGSALADERAKEQGYCRVHMPSIPRTGSTWFRLMFEVITRRPTAAVWPEGGILDAERRYHISHDPCGGHPNPMEGRSAPNFDDGRFCRNVELPGLHDPVLVKSHTPFYPSWDMRTMYPDAACAVLLLVRNPLDAHHALSRYDPNAPLLRPYLASWAGHIEHWVTEVTDLPLLVIRYEDLLYDAVGTMRRVMQQLPGKWVWSQELIDVALQEFGPKKPFEEKCGSNVEEYTPEEIDMVQIAYSNTLRKFGYLLSNEKQAS